MSGPLFVTLADINMIHKKTDVWWSIFYKRYVDAIYNRRQENTVDKLYDGLSNYHPKVKLTVETIKRKPNYQHYGHLIFLKGIKGIPLKTKLYRAKLISSNFTNEVTLIRNKVSISRLLIVLYVSLLIAQANDDNEFIIPPWFLKVKKKNSF